MKIAKTLRKRVEYDPEIEKMIHDFVVKDTFITSILHLALCRFNMIRIKITRNFILGEKVTLQFIWKHKVSRRVYVSLNKKNKAEGITLPDLKTYYMTGIIKTAWF